MKEYSLNIFGKEYCQVYGGYGKQEWNVEWKREICAGTPVKITKIFLFLIYFKANHKKSNAKHSSGGHDPCTGDSGGPLTCIRG